MSTTAAVGVFALVGVWMLASWLNRREKRKRYVDACNPFEDDHRHIGCLVHGTAVANGFKIVGHWWIGINTKHDGVYELARSFDGLWIPTKSIIHTPGIRAPVVSALIMQGIVTVKPMSYQPLNFGQAQA